MKDDNSLIRISLQFFGGNDDDDFDDDFDYEDEEEVEEEDYDEAEEADEESDEDEKPAKGKKTTGGDADVIAELKAAGYVGDDLAALVADMKKKREAREKDSAGAERRAAMAEGKGHIKSGKPRKGADGGVSGGVTERRVRGLAETLKCSPQRARVLLEKHTRLINGG